jgi:hypothetical protein
MSTLLMLALATYAQLPDTPKASALTVAHFASPEHAFVWRNWQLVPTERMAGVLGCSEDDVRKVGKAMGLSDPPAISAEQWERSYITIIRRNWHLLPYSQMTQLLGWSSEQLAFTLQEDDFLYVKLGLLKPECPPLRFSTPLPGKNSVSDAVQRIFPGGLPKPTERLFAFVEDLSQPLPSASREEVTSAFSPRFCYSYFSLYGDPLADGSLDPYPDGYLDRLSQSGVNGVWLQAVLYTLSPFPWEPSLSTGYEARLRNLAALVERAQKKGIRIYLYLNEPRSMPLSFFEKHAGLKGVTERDRASLCTSAPEVRDYITKSVESICRAVPDLGGFFTITASENLSNCWSHYQGAQCPRCKERTADEVIAELNASVQSGIDRAGTKSTLFAWDWGWQDQWAEAAIRRLPKTVSLMSVSEWSIPIERGGIKNDVGEYSISTIGPGPRATKHWRVARESGLGTIAKIQAGTTWELGSMPYIPALENVAKHAVNLREANVNGLMLGWTLGGYPSPNLEVVAALGTIRADGSKMTIDEALNKVAARRFGPSAAAVVDAWKACSAAFSQFPYNGAVVYNAPLQSGPSNLLWEKPTGYRATMVGIPYDDLAGWRGNYPEDVFANLFVQMADEFDEALSRLKGSAASDATPAHAGELRREMNVIEAASIHFRSIANQTRFIVAREALAKAATKAEAKPQLEALDRVLRSEQALALKLYEIQCRDSRIGFEATNHYFYIPMDLLEKAVNCEDLLVRWLPEQAKRVESLQ